MSDLVTAINDFGALTLKRLKGELPLEARAELDVLEELLREHIDGARPAPKKLENPTAVATARPSNAAVRPAQVVVTRREAGAASSVGVSVAPAGVSVGPAPGVAPPPPGGRVTVSPASRSTAAPPSAAAARASAAAPAPARPSGPARPVDLAAQIATDDRKKLSEVSAREIPRSSYTPPVDRPFADDYFDGVSGEGSGESSATRIIVRGEAPPPEVRVMFGVRDVVDRGAVNLLDVDLGPPPQPIQTSRARRSAEPRSGSDTQLGGDGDTRAMPAQRVSAPSPASRAPARPSGTPRPDVEAPPGRTPVAVHLADGGGSLRGELVTLDVEANLLVLATPQGEQALELGGVLVVLLGVPRGGRPTQAQGTALAVKLANGQELEGLSPDYAPGAPAMTLVPSERKGAVDAVWIPAWSVVEIRIVG